MSTAADTVVLMLITRALLLTDIALHWLLDPYINRQLPGWGLLQVGQWHVCNAYETRPDRVDCDPR